MSLLTALAISIGGLGGIAAWIYLGPLDQALQIWATFIAWGCFYHCGGKETGLKNTIVCTLAGAVVGWITLIVVANTGGIGGALPAGLWAGICVGIGVAAMVLLANVPLFATIPAQVYGFAAVAGYFLLKGGDLFSASLGSSAAAGNPLLTVGVSLIAGAILGYISEKIGVALSSSGTHRAAA